MKGFLVVAILGFGAWWVYQEEQDRKRKYVTEQLANNSQFDAAQLTSGEVSALYEVFKKYPNGGMPSALQEKFDAIKTKYNILT